MVNFKLIKTYFIQEEAKIRNLFKKKFGVKKIVSILEKKVSAPVPKLDLGFGRTLVHSGMLSIFTAFQCLCMIGLFSATIYLMEQFFYNPS